MTIKLGQYRDKQSGEAVAVIWQSDELVTYQTASKTLNTVRKFVFMRDFEAVEA